MEGFLDGQFVGDNSKVTYRAALRRFYDVLVDHQVVPVNPADQAGLGIKRRSATAWAGSAKAGAVNAQDPLPTLDEMKADIRELNPAAMDDNPAMLDAGVVLLAGQHLGTGKIMPISRFTGISPRRVAKFAKRLRASGVWTKDGKPDAEWLDGGGGFALLVDIHIATGPPKRRGPSNDKRGEPISDAGKK